MLLRIFQMIATSGFLTALECNKFVFGRGSARGTPLGSLHRFPSLLAGLRGPNSRGRGEEEEEREGGGKRKRSGGTPLSQIPASSPDLHSKSCRS